MPGHDAERFEVARAGGLDMKHGPCVARAKAAIHRQLVGTGVQAQLVRSEQLGNRRVIVQRRFERGQVSLVVDTFFEVADEPRREAHQLHAVMQALIGNDVVLGERGRLFGFVDGQLDFVVATGGFVDTCRMWSARSSRPTDGPSVLDGRPHAGFFRSRRNCRRGQPCESADPGICRYQAADSRAAANFSRIVASS